MNDFIPPVGLLNFGKIGKKKKKGKTKNLYLYNICYINSSIQCLFRLEEFPKNIKNCSGGKITDATRKLINEMILFDEKSNDNLNVYGIKEAMTEVDEKYKKNEPEDANEFISNYLNAILDETSDKLKINEIKCYDESDKEYFDNFYNKFYQKKGSSFILDLFYGILRTENYCKHCNKYIFSIKFHEYNILELPIYNLIKNDDKPLNLKNILINYTSEKMIANRSCSKCGNKICKRTYFYTLPKCLILYFERKDENNYIEKDIDIPLSFNFNEYLYNNKNNEKSEIIYNFKGVIYYSFIDDNYGHYTASCQIDDKWYYFDDDTYSKGEKLFYIPYKNEYPILLFYEK